MNSIQPLFSIIIPLFNKAETISFTLNSIYKQSFIDYEVVIVNDGSTDNSLNVIENLPKFNTSIYNKTNGGVSSARNFGVECSRGEFILFLDSDDFLLSNCLEVYSRAIKKFPLADFYVTNFQLFDEAQTKNNRFFTYDTAGYIEDPYKILYFEKFFIRMGNFIIRKNKIENFLQFNTKLQKYEDYDFIIRALKYVKVFYTNDITMKYNISSVKESIKIPRVNNEWAGILKIQQNDNKYEKLIKAKHVSQVLFKRIKLKDFLAVKLLITNNLNVLHLIIFSTFRLILKRLIKFNIQ